MYSKPFILSMSHEVLSEGMSLFFLNATEKADE